MSPEAQPQASTRETPAARLRAMIRSGRMVIAPGVYDGVSANLVVRAGFEAAYMSGGSTAVALTGMPDLGLTTMTEMADQVGRLAAVMPVPMIADADTGFGGPLHAQRTIRAYERAGAAALHLEDQEFPKRCGHLQGKKLVPAGEFVAKLEAVVDARTDPDFMIIARTDAIAVAGFDEAVRRAKLYVAAGADMVFFEAPQSLEQIEQGPSRVDAPVMFNSLPSSAVTPEVPMEQLEQWGYAVTIAPAACLAPHMAAVQAALLELRATGREIPPAVSLQEMFNLVGLRDLLALSERYVTRPDAALGS